MYARALNEFSAMMKADNPSDRKLHHDRMVDAASKVPVPEERGAAAVSTYTDRGEAPPLHKQEFARFAQTKPSADDAACRGAKFRLSSPQLFVRNLVSPFTPYNGVLLFHGVGVGKTCTAIQVAEAFRSVFSHKAIVLGPTNLVPAFKGQVFDPSRGTSQCTGDLYLSSLASTVSGSPADGTYEFMGYQKFANYVQNVRDSMPGNEDAILRRLGREFSNRVIIIDEVQNLRKIQNQNKGISRAMESILSFTENTKLVLLTATPLYNDVDELRFLMELLYLNDKRFDEAEKTRSLRLAKFPLDEGAKRQIASFASGYVSYVRGGSPSTFPLRIWPPDAALPKDLPRRDVDGNEVPGIKHLRICLHRLSPMQAAAYEARSSTPSKDSVESEIQKTIDDTDLESPDNGGIRYTSLGQICNIVYPNNLHGRDGFDAAFRSVRNAGGIKYEYQDPSHQFLDADKIQPYSPKFAALIKKITGATGVVLVYSRFVYGCLLPLAFALEHAGLNNMNGNLLSNSVRRRRTETPARYALLVAEANAVGASASQNNRAKVIAAARSVKNVDGKVVKVVLFSGAAAEGTDFRFVRELHIMDPWHNLSRIEQIIGRGVRNCSHSLLPEEHRNCSVYLHAAAFGDGRETVDVAMYRDSERKQLMISSVERIMKANALDCSLNRKAFLYPSKKIRIVDAQGRASTVEDGDQDFSQACDFDRCDFECASRPIDKIDRSTDDVHFMHMDPYKEVIADAFETSASHTYPQLQELAKAKVDRFEPEVLMHALSIMMDSRSEVKYRGAPGYLIYRSDKYIFQPLAKNDQRIPMSERRTASHKLREVERVRVPKLDERVVPEKKALADMQAFAATVCALRKGIPAHVGMDFALDHVDHGTYVAAAVAAMNGSAADVRASLERGHAISGDGFFDPFDLAYRDSKGVRMPQYRERKTRAEHGEAMRAFLAKARRRGYVSCIRGKPTFKMIQAHRAEDPTTSGVVCMFFSKIKTSQMVKMVQELQPQWQGGNRRDACWMYEIALRLRGECLRPTEAHYFSRKR
jgi:hypothetical protein